MWWLKRSKESYWKWMHPCNFTSLTLSFARVYKYLQFNKVFSWYKCCKKYFLKVVFISMKKVVAVPRFRQCSYGPPLQSASPALAANWLLIGTKIICRRPLKNSSFFQKGICPQPLPPSTACWSFWMEPITN